ncbi:hypothetical protein PoB_007453800 [Plakobranchus ocellatus]|uniref:Uncharacterized protein n=1 Tax=Plakobranchus ocellatus TaxID=259542 RepID=A0AAV4DUT0_9GAST|nr:hypothetical protein PoB_007453800 [Plakobranchus ocellatus]
MVCSGSNPRESQRSSSMVRVRGCLSWCAVLQIPENFSDRAPLLGATSAATLPGGTRRSVGVFGFLLRLISSLLLLLPLAVTQPADDMLGQPGRDIDCLLVMLQQHSISPYPSKPSHCPSCSSQVLLTGSVFFCVVLFLVSYLVMSGCSPRTFGRSGSYQI